MLNKEEQTRYANHILLKQIGGAGQTKLKQAKVLMVGAGGLGAPCLLYLAAAGIGTIGIIDDDVVELSNLQRQIIYNTYQLNQPKVEVAKTQLQKLNPEIDIVIYNEKLSNKNAAKIIANYDFIADGSDNFKTRFLVNDVCYFAQKPLTSAAIGEWTGQIVSFRSFEKTNNIPNPNWRCFVGSNPIDAQNCQTGIIGALSGIIGSLQALEIIKQITGAGDNLLNKIMIYDGTNNQSRIIKLNWDKNNLLNGVRPQIKRADFY